MTQTRRKLFAVLLASLLMCSAFAPGALAATATAANAQVSVDTDAAADVSADSARLNGNVTELNNSNATVSFEYWMQGDQANSTTVEVGELTGPGTFDAEVTGLSANTTYVYVAKAEANGSAATGSQETFTTLETLSVSVETGAATNVTERNATLAGNLTHVSGTENASVAVRYWVQGDRTTTTVVQAGEQSEGDFSVAVSGLDANTTYSYVALAEAERGDETAEDSGNESTFTTGETEESLGVETLDASDLTNDSATLNGDLTGIGGAENATVAFEYWVEGDRANSTNTTDVELDSPGTFSAAVSGLQNDTAYVYVAQAQANDTTVTGEQVTFETEVGTENETDTGNESDGPFGQTVSAFVAELVQQRTDANETQSQNIGLQVAAFVTATNPGQGNGPPAFVFGDGGNETDDRGPPAFVTGDDDGNETDRERGPPEDRGPDEDKERGPPEDRGPDRADDDDTDEEETEEETETEEADEEETEEDDDADTEDGDDGADDAENDDSAPGNSGDAPGQ
ncbi:hypothetical protein [Haloglomus salinum]|uniref:hypothetical protein n=1 Tax=Haloglomus salinum TaxID=2962673 RepID=UPI0020C967C5|nr:hypothetical protein [Haloglomus salinum]